MKWILSASILANVVLAYYFVRVKKDIVPQYEKLIVENHIPNEDMVKTSMAAPAGILPGDLDQVEDMNDSHQRMERSRTNFLTGDLQLSPETIFEYQRIRGEYFDKTSTMWKKDPYAEMDFAQKRKLLDLEEKLHKDLASLLGPSKWVQYREYRENYNKRGFEKQVEENQPFLFMGL